jgi:hypothetical protein
MTVRSNSHGGTGGAGYQSIKYDRQRPLNNREKPPFFNGFRVVEAAGRQRRSQPIHLDD